MEVHGKAPFIGFATDGFDFKGDQFSALLLAAIVRGACWITLQEVAFFRGMLKLAHRALGTHATSW